VALIRNPAGSSTDEETILVISPMKMSHPLLALIFAGAALTVTALGADVAANWKEHCAKCHGDTGKGDTKMGRKLSISDLTDPAAQAKFTDEDSVKAMNKGVNAKDGKVLMKPVENLSPEEIKALAAYVRTLKK